MSIGQGGTFDNDGNALTFHDAAQLPIQNFQTVDGPTAARSELAISDSGNQVFFTSGASLVPQAQSGQPSVYEYREGDVYLISDGRDASKTAGSPSVTLFGITPSGHDAFFLTADALLPQAPEAQLGIYDAREEGGFPALAPTPGCAGETCRGSAGVAPLLPSPGSASQVGGGNLAPSPKTTAKAGSTPKRLTRAQKLAAALRACRHRHGKRHAVCEARARRLYGGSKARRRSAGTARSVKSTAGRAR